MLVYLLKVSVVMGVALLFYKCVLQQESFFTTNRLYFIACLLLAFALPAVTLPPLVSHQGYLAEVFQAAPVRKAAAPIQPQAAATRRQPKALAQPQQPLQLSPADAEAATPKSTVVTPEPPHFYEQTDWLFWLTMLYSFGVAVFALNLLVQVGSLLYRAARNPDKVTDGTAVIVNIPDRQAPCSFFRYIFIYPDDYDFDTYGQIIAHEKIHVRLGHSFDLLLAELAVAVLWFNPLVWLYKRELVKNIEYQTDAILLHQEPVNKRQYQLNLLQIACPNKPLSITTNYNQSLLKQRILMMNTKKSTWHSYWKYAFLAPLFFGTLLFLNEPARSREITSQSILITAPPAGNARLPETKSNWAKAAPAEPVGQAQRPAPINPSNSRKDDMTQGYWYSHREGNQYCLELKGNNDQNHNWNISRCFDQKLFQKKGNGLYELSREAGTLRLTGALEEEVSQGKYTFTENPDFRKYLADNQIKHGDENFMFHLFLGDVNQKYVAYLKQQNGAVTGEELQQLAILGVSMDKYQQVVRLYGQYSNKKPTTEEVVAAKIHGIDEAFVQELQAMGYENLSMEKMTEAKIHGISSAYVQNLRQAGFDNLPIDKVIEAKIHGLKQENISSMQDLGFGKLSLDKMIELRIHGISKDFVAEMKSAGFDNLTLDQVITAKIHGLNPASIREIRALGFKDMDFDDMVAVKIHGVNAAYIAELKKAGIENLTLDDAVAAKIHGINSAFVQKAKKDGYNLKTVDEYVTLKIHGMALESLKKN